MTDAGAGRRAGGRGLVYAGLVAAPLFWAVNFLVGESFLQQGTALQVSAYRWVLGLPVLAVLAWLIEKPSLRSALGEWPRHLFAGLAGAAGYSWLNYAAIDFTSGIEIALIAGATPAVITLGAALLLRERIGALAVAGIALSLGGVVLVITRGDLGRLAGLGTGTGELLGIASVLAWTVYTLINRRVATPPVTAVTIQGMIGLAALLPFIVVEGAPIAFTALGWWQLVVIAVFPTVLAFVFWNLGVRSVGPAGAGVFINLIPVFAVALGLALGGAVDGWQLAGGAVVIAGVLLTNLRPRRVH